MELKRQCEPIENMRRLYDAYIQRRPAYLRPESRPMQINAVRMNLRKIFEPANSSYGQLKFVRVSYGLDSALQGRCIASWAAQALMTDSTKFNQSLGQAWGMPVSSYNQC